MHETGHNKNKLRTTCVLLSILAYLKDLKHAVMNIASISRFRKPGKFKHHTITMLWSDSSSRITDHYSSAELGNLIAAAEKVCKK
jgi:hypothetical protein